MSIIQSPFFRDEILARYASDALQAADYPRTHAASLFQPCDEAQGEPQLPPLTAANTHALREAAQAIAAQLVLVDKAAAASVASSAAPAGTSADAQLPAERKLTAASLRAHLAATLILLNQHTRALAHLNLASDALRPRPNSSDTRKGKQRQDKDTPDDAPSEAPASAAPAPTILSPAEDARDALRTTLWILTERACLALGKDDECKRVRRWRTTLELQRAARARQRPHPS